MEEKKDGEMFTQARLESKLVRFIKAIAEAQGIRITDVIEDLVEEKYPSAYEDYKRSLSVIEKVIANDAKNKKLKKQ